MGAKVAEIEKIASEIVKHKHAYYSGQPIISDVDYDKLEEKLRDLQPNHPVLNLVGIEPKGKVKKVTHQTPMLSLNKSYSFEDLIAWKKDYDLVGTIKVDGNSLSLVYEDGLLKQGKTRGNGVVGEDVTEKILWTSDIPHQVEGLNRFEVRGELFCYEAQFLHLCEEMIQRKLEKPSSPRNIVAGLLGRKEHLDLLRYCNFFAFDVITEEQNFSLEEEKFHWLNSQGFATPMMEVLKKEKQIADFLERVRQKIADDELGIDGAVFCYNDVSSHEALGNTAHHPRYKMSFKWQGETAEAEIINIIWATSRLGVVTPVAVIKPVVLSGATIQNITLHNAQHVKLYDLKAGDKIEVVRSGEVIPKFLRVIESSKGEAVLPETCNSCESRLVFDDVRLICPNKELCPQQQSGQILNWIRCAEIDDLSEKRLQQLIDSGMVETVPDLYKLKVDDFLKLPLTKEKMASKLYVNIQNSKSLPLAKFLNGLGIKGAGITTWEAILAEYPSLDSVRKLKPEQLMALSGFAEKSANQIVDGLAEKGVLIDQLIEVGVTPAEPEKPSGTGEQPFAGMTFVITGSLSKPRSEVEAMIKQAGGKTSGSVSKNTTALITDDPDSGSSKAKKAKSLGIEIWDEQALMSKLS